MNTLKTVYILRGLPGSGKSSYIERNLKHLDPTVCSADHFFINKDGVYKFDRDSIALAHDWCFVNFLESVVNGTQFVVVDNTYTRLWEFKRYLEVCRIYNYNIIVLRFNVSAEVSFQRNTHSVPLEHIERMAARFEPFEGEVLVNEVCNVQSANG